MNEGEKNKNVVNLIALKPGEKAAFIGISDIPGQGCHRAHKGKGKGNRKHHHQHGKFSHIGFMQRLEAMGVRPGVFITKISDQFLHGPVIIEVGRTQLAIGYGMAAKIIVNLGVIDK